MLDLPPRLWQCSFKAVSAVAMFDVCCSQNNHSGANQETADAICLIIGSLAPHRSVDSANGADERNISSPNKIKLLS
jgi:hypothetical protein